MVECVVGMAGAHALERRSGAIAIVLMRKRPHWQRKRSRTRGMDVLIVMQNLATLWPDRLQNGPGRRQAANAAGIALGRDQSEVSVRVNGFGPV